MVTACGHDEPLWWLTKESDVDCLALYERHYSCYRYADGRRRRQFVGPGEKVVLRSEHGDAMWVWRYFHDDSGQQGINAAVFRNESRHQSSRLIRQADQVADCLWPDRRHYTYIDPARVASKKPWILLYCGLLATLRANQRWIADYGTHNCRMHRRAKMTMLMLQGHVCEIGDFNTYQEKHKAGPSRGLVLEVGDRDICIIGLSKKELRQIAGSFGQALSVTLEFEDPTFPYKPAKHT